VQHDGRSVHLRHRLPSLQGGRSQEEVRLERGPLDQLLMELFPYVLFFLCFFYILDLKGWYSVGL
jgi:hypothetical protein